MGEAFTQLSLGLPSADPEPQPPSGPRQRTRSDSIVRRARLTLGEAARIMREAVKDKSYRSTPVGLEVAQFIRWFRNEYGATSETLRDYEAILAKLAIDHADLELAAFEPPDGTTRLREFIDERWGDAAPRTRKKVRAILMSFFKWAQAEFKIQGNPVVPIRSPRLRDVERELFSAEDVVGIVASQPELRDRVALKLLFLMGLRKGELAATRYRDFDLGRRRLQVHGKGGKIRQTPIPTEELRQEIAELSLRRDPLEHLLYPQKRGPKGTVIWEDRRKPLSGPPSIAGGIGASPAPASSTRGRRTARRCTAPATRQGPSSTSPLATSTRRSSSSVTPTSARPPTSTSRAQPQTSKTSSGRSTATECGQLFRSRPFSRNRSDRNTPICGDDGGGGNRTRVRSRTGGASTSIGCPFSSPAGRGAAALPTG
jgi:integrase